MRSKLFSRSMARANLGKLRGGLNRRYSTRRTVVSGSLAGAGLVTVGGMQYPAMDVAGATDAAVDIYNAGRPAAARYAPAYGASANTGASGATSSRASSTASDGRRALYDVSDILSFDVSVLAAMLDQDGAGSTLDADTVDGVHAAALLLADGSQPGATGAAQIFDNGIEADTIAEATVDAGVTVDGVLLKDATVTADQFVATTPATLTTEDISTINSGDATTDDVIANLRTRLGELEAALQALGLLA